MDAIQEELGCWTLRGNTYKYLETIKSANVIRQWDPDNKRWLLFTSILPDEIAEVIKASGGSIIDLDGDEQEEDEGLLPGEFTVAQLMQTPLELPPVPDAEYDAILTRLVKTAKQWHTLQTGEYEGFKRLYKVDKYSRKQTLGDLRDAAKRVLLAEREVENLERLQWRWTLAHQKLAEYTTAKPTEPKFYDDLIQVAQEAITEMKRFILKLAETKRKAA